MPTYQELKMVFETEGGKKHTISLNNPKDTLTRVQVEEAMSTVIEKDVIMTNSGGLIDIVEAYILDKEKTPILP